MDGRIQKLCLSDLLDQDISSYEFFHSLPEPIQKEIEAMDIGSFDEMQAFAYDHRMDAIDPL